MIVLSLSYDDKFKNQIAGLIEDRRIRLASKSPRRREILRMLDVEYEVFVSDAEDNFRNEARIQDPVDRSVAVTRLKAEDGSVGMSDGIVIAADTIVVLDGEVLDKPTDRADALRHLKRLRGRSHHVYTTVVLRDVDGGGTIHGIGDSEVTFYDVSDDELRAYVETGEPDDKAGAYGIQGMGKFLVEKYTGQLDNIIGFPTIVFAELLRELDRKRREI